MFDNNSKRTSFSQKCLLKLLALPNNSRKGGLDTVFLLGWSHFSPLFQKTILIPAGDEYTRKDGVIYQAQLAATLEAIAKGLGGRRNPLKPNEAMRFVFDRPGPQTFWMKNTWIPLSVLFFGENSRLISSQKMDVEENPPRPIFRYSESKPGLCHIGNRPERSIAVQK